MASKIAICGICDLRQITKPSDVWCSECDEGLCLECKEHHGLSKATRNHNTVPVSKYENLPTNVLEISQFCSKHNDKFQLYCKKHELPCCSRCVVSDHQKCQDFIQLDDMIRNVKKSYGVHDIEQTLIDMGDNIQRIQKDRQANLSSLKKERQMIEKEIEQTRIKINAQLDKFQENIMKELYDAESKESKMIVHMLDSIDKNAMEIRKYQENLLNIKQHASDLQTFLAMKQMERDVAEKDEYFTSLVKSNKLNRVSLSYKMNDSYQNSFYKIQNLGEIIVSSHSSEVPIVGKKETQAQTVAAHVRSMAIDNLSFVLQSTIDTKLEDITGCMLLPDGNAVFTCNKKRCVRGFNSAGSKDFDISLKPATTTGITYIEESNSIAVTEGAFQNISIIDLKSKKVKETIPLQQKIFGIVSRNNTLIYCAQNRGLLMLNLTDKSVNDIVTSSLSEFACVTTFADKLYFINSNTRTVTCCDLHGSIHWGFHDESVLKDPFGVAVDNAGNVYVVGHWSHNVVVISPDGKHHRQLLSEKNGLASPQAIHYDRSTNQLLVANEKRKAFLYSLE